VVAVDHTRAMIQAVWPGPPGSAVVGEWTDLPVGSASCHVALCDGGMHLLDHLDGQRALAESLARVVVPGGTFVTRLFVPPAEPERPEAVLDDLLAGGVANVNLLKMRLLMSLQADPVAGVELAAAWKALNRACPDYGELARRIGWRAEDLAAVDTYRDCPIRYHFVTVEDVRRLFCVEPGGGFDLVSVDVPSYELGDRCPTVHLRRRAR
jgi:SAM-dependent methyltransferase